MSKQTAVVVALWLLGASGMLASIVAAILLWRDVRAGEARDRSPQSDPESTKEEA